MAKTFSNAILKIIPPLYQIIKLLLLKQPEQIHCNKYVHHV